MVGNILYCMKRGLFNWLNQDDRMNMTEPWQQQTLITSYEKGIKETQNKPMETTLIER